MKDLPRRSLRTAAVFAMFLIAACANTTKTNFAFDADSPHWQGRLWLKLLTTPAQAFSADFDLQGSAKAGEMTFSTPLGSTVARLQWDASSAVLHTTGAPEHFESLDALTRRATGTNLPVANLFAWLQGKNMTTPGWEVDLQQIVDGHLRAKRLGSQMDAPAELTIRLDR